MAAFSYQGTIQFRRQNSAQWTASNPVLKEGELGLELDTKSFKIGDGITPWTSLDYGGLLNPSGPTAEVGDNSSLYATTAFVQNLTMGISTTTITGSTTLNSAQTGTKIIVLDGELTEDATITMPANGFWSVYNNTDGGYSLILTNGNTATVTLNAGDAAAVVSAPNGVDFASTIAATPPAGDSSNKIATTEFVQMLNNGTGTVPITGDTTLNPAQYSYACVIFTGSLSANAVVTVPTQGWWTFVNNTTGGYSVLLTNGNPNTTTITPNDSAEIISNLTGVNITTTITNTIPPGKNDNSVASTAFVQSVPYRRNRILNGQFDVWQRGMSWTNPTSGTYTADKWRIDYTGPSVGSFTIGQALGGTQPSGLTASLGPNGAYSWNHSSAPNLTSLMLSHRCEGIYTLNGQTCTASFSIALGAGSASPFQIGVNLAQCFGTGGAPSPTVTQPTQYFTVNSSNFTRFSATFQLPATSGTLGTNSNDYLALQFVLPTNRTFSFYLVQVQLEAGPVATAYMVQTTQQEILQCLRFYQKTFPTSTAPTYNTGIYSSPLTINQGSTGVSQWVNWDFDIPMRGNPTVTYYSVGNNPTGYWTSYSGAVTTTNLPTSKVSSSGVSVGTPPSIGANTTYVIHATADADL